MVFFLLPYRSRPVLSLLPQGGNGIPRSVFHAFENVGRGDLCKPVECLARRPADNVTRLLGIQQEDAPRFSVCQAFGGRLPSKNGSFTERCIDSLTNLRVVKVRAWRLTHPAHPTGNRCAAGAHSNLSATAGRNRGSPTPSASAKSPSASGWPRCASTARAGCWPAPTKAPRRGSRPSSCASSPTSYHTEPRRTASAARSGPAPASPNSSGASSRSRTTRTTSHGC